ncbi:MAG: polysaccharide deacetylase family protein [Clostridiales bacterium]|nr:polysaccharide deacetylase family protein [Clostridiales bacterium]MCF8022864.1 polysaccharide deacetylase family protein [Clostridiales bacterium]
MPKKKWLYGILGLLVLALLVVVIYRGAPGLSFAVGQDNQVNQEEKNTGESDKEKEPEISPAEQAKLTGANELGYVPILVYHRIGEEEGRWTRTPENFRKDLEELYSKGYTLVSLTSYLKGNIDIPAGKSPAIITFDDSTPGHFRLLKEKDTEEDKYKVDPDCAAGILKEFGEKHEGFGHTATFYVNANPFSGEEGQEGLWKKKLKMLQDWGFEIGNHTYHHENMGDLTPEEVQSQIAKLQDHIQQALPAYKPETLAIVQDGVPEPYNLLVEGKYKETEYKHLGVVKWAWRDAYSPYHKDFDPYHIQRIQVFQDHGESSLVNWLNRIEHRRYVSDGNTKIVSIPESSQQFLSEEMAKEVVTYTMENAARTLEKEEQANNARGMHVTYSYASSQQRWKELISLVENTQLNAIQLDVKDESGYIGYDSSVHLAQEIGAAKDYMPVKEMLQDLRDRGIYSVARIVVSRDPVLAKKKPEYMVKNKGGAPIGGGVWVNPRKQDVVDYNLNLAQEAFEMGFNEVQFDYIRFPEGSDVHTAHYGTEDKRHRVEVITDFFKYAREKIGWEKRISAAIFGFMGYAQDDQGIGQRPERLGTYLDYMSPMVYPSHFGRGNYGYSNPNANPYGIVDKSLSDFEELLHPTGCKLRPWLQAFTMGSPQYGREEIQDQINAAQNHDINTWLLWNPGVNYDKSEITP